MAACGEKPVSVDSPRRGQAAQRQFGEVETGGPRDVTEPLFEARVLIVKDRRKVFEVKAEYAIYDDSGRLMAAVREVGHSLAKRAIGGKYYYQDKTRRLEVVDTNGRVLLRLNRPSNSSDQRCW